MRNFLNSLGFFKFDEGMESCRERVLNLFQNTSSLAANKIQIFPSSIGAEPASKFQPKALIIDIGGSSTKAALRVYDKLDSIINWSFLFEIQNSALRGDVSGFSTFCDAVAGKIADRLSQLIMSQHDIKALGIVWSNPMESRLIPGLGVNGVVTSRASYNKNEWFISDLKDGDDLGAVLLNAFKKMGVTISSLVVSNDVPLTLKALSGASAGVVVSTGANGTIVQTLKDGGGPFRKAIFNAELGKNLKIGTQYLTQVDHGLGDSSGVSVEYLIAGKFLGPLLTKYVIHCAKSGFEQFKRFADKLEEMGEKAQTFFSTKDLAGLVNHNQATIRSLGPYVSDPACLDALAELSNALLVRAAKMAGLLCFASIANQIEDKAESVIALDSRLSREIPLYWEVLRTQVTSLAGSSKRVKLQLLQPLEIEQGTISVPMLGAAAALDNLYK